MLCAPASYACICLLLQAHGMCKSHFCVLQAVHTAAIIIAAGWRSSGALVRGSGSFRIGVAMFGVQQVADSTSERHASCWPSPYERIKYNSAAGYRTLNALQVSPAGRSDDLSGCPSRASADMQIRAPDPEIPLEL